MRNASLHGGKHVGHGVAVGVVRVEEEVDIRVGIQQTAGGVVHLQRRGYARGIPEADRLDAHGRELIQHKFKAGKRRHAFKRAAERDRQTHDEVNIKPAVQALLDHFD